MIGRGRNVEGEGSRRSTSRGPGPIRAARPALPLVAVVGALVWLGAACGGGSGSTSAASPPAGATNAASGGSASTSAPIPGSGSATQPGATGATAAGSPTVTGRPATLTAPRPTSDRPTVQVSSDGLTVVAGADLTPLPFGTARDKVVTALSRVLGGAGAPQAVSPECGNRADESIDWPGQLRVDFRKGTLISWRLDRGSLLTTDSGFGLGATRAQVESSLAIAVSDTSLGVEFTTDSEGPLLNGLFSGEGQDATVTELWAGQVCAFR